MLMLLLTLGSVTAPAAFIAAPRPTGRASWPLSQAEQGYTVATTAAEQTAAVAALIGRTLPDHALAASKFNLSIVTSCAPPDKRSCFAVRAGETAGGIAIAATTGVELAAGFHWYLKHGLNASVTWRNTGGSSHGR
jgi:hypothetical protein